MTRIRTTTLGVAVLAVGLLLAGCASSGPKTAASVAPTPTTPATASTPPAPVVQAVPVAQVAPVAQAVPVAQTVPVAQVAPAAPVAPASTPPAPTVATTPASTPPSASASPAASTSPSASTPPSGSAPHFTTPDDAMRYLVAAYNRHDIAAEMHVTTPDARTQLEAERQWVNTFSFDSCDVDGTQGDYICTFDMTSMVPTTAADSPAADSTATDSTAAVSIQAATEMAEITVIVAPAARPGWYMYASQGCGG
jgi:hypothetical protein